MTSCGLLRATSNSSSRMPPGSSHERQTVEPAGRLGGGLLGHRLALLVALQRDLDAGRGHLRPLALGQDGVGPDPRRRLPDAGELDAPGGLGDRCRRCPPACTSRAARARFRTPRARPPARSRTPPARRWRYDLTTWHSPHRPVNEREHPRRSSSVFEVSDRTRRRLDAPGCSRSNGPGRYSPRGGGVTPRILRHASRFPWPSDLRSMTLRNTEDAGQRLRTARTASAEPRAQRQPSC